MECMRNQLLPGAVLNDRYETVAPLNHGSFGMVFQARDLLTNEMVAIKVITKPNASVCNPLTLAIDDRSEELGIHLRIASHPNVVNLLQSFETPNHVYLVLEFCANGDLYEAIRLGKGPLETEHVRDFMIELVNAVQYIHSRGIYHRDIKPENIFLSQAGTMKLGDFGLATKEPWSWEIAVGSDRYMAPEQFDPSNIGYSTAKADVWALGICLLNVLFSRNPFAVPASSDPLYADFALDRQSLFDVFPNMSQDTYEVLTHCLAVDPAKRDLSLVKEALLRVISFTTDDERLDEFCTEERDPIVPSANREPLRTPSISTPHFDVGGSFPWAKALALSPHHPVRQLSAIPDTEIFSGEFLPTSDGVDVPWFEVKSDNASMASFVDSGLGLSFQSIDVKPKDSSDFARSRPVPISGSLPSQSARPIGSTPFVFGKKRDVFSKSWSDLWDEEEDEHAIIVEIENNYTHDSFAPENKAVHSESGSGVSTPRNEPSVVKNSTVVCTSGNRSSHKTCITASHVSEHTGFIFEEHTSPLTRYSPPSKRSVLDKWAALGDRRRQNQTPYKSINHSGSAQPTLNSYGKRSRTGSWRRPVHWGPSQSENAGVWERQHDTWIARKDWRKPTPPFHDEIGDFEWVGGWHDLHL